MSAAAVEIEAVEEIAHDSPRIADYHLELPVAGTGSDRFAIGLRGWVVPREAPAEAIRVFGDPQLTHETPVDVPRPDIGELFPDCAHASTSGFESELNALRLRPEFELSIAAVLESGESLRLATVAGRRGSLDDVGGSARLRPVIVSTPTGRTGTTWLVHLLGRHPEMIAYRPFAHEPRVATYWLEVGYALTDPASYKQAIDPDLGRGPSWWLGGWPEAARRGISGEEVARALGRQSVEAAIGFACGQVDAFYRAVGREAGKKPRLFVEKGGSFRQLEGMADVMYPELSELALVRDPRDVLCSILAYKRKRPEARFVRDSPGLDDDFLREIEVRFQWLFRHARRFGERVLLVRYEDLVLDPRSTMAGVLDHLGLDSSGEVAQAMIDSEAAGAGQHQTASSPESSIGRWRDDLGEADRERVTAAFSGVLTELGYD